ncbi:MAG: hypothetical protein R3B13_33875 [Polyangiaceae bacterium]
MRHLLGTCASGVVLSAVCWSGGAQAEQPRDYFLNAPTAGTFAHLDAYTVGAQVSLENRADLEPGMSMLHTRLSGIVSYPYVDGSANVDVRVFLLTFGVSAGYRHVYRDHTFAPGEDDSLEARRQREKDDAFGTQSFTHYEGRARLVIPLDPFFMVHTGTLRNEDRNDNSFDWFHANVHDGGLIGKYETTLFFRHRDFGAVGPYFRYMSIPTTRADGSHERTSEIHLGGVIGTRPGFIRPRGGNTDLALLQVVAKPGDGDYGFHGYNVPLYILGVYRATLSLF